MALQDVCGFDEACFNPKYNSSLLSSMYLESTWLEGSYGPSPLEFYVPVHKYLTESPIEFGQVHPDLNSLWTDSQEDDDHQHSLPCLSLNSPIPFSVYPSVPLPFPLGHGTTTLGFIFQDGVIAAADSRSSCGGLVACPASAKILPVHSHLVGTTSGTSADCALWKRILARELRLYQLRYKKRLSTGGAAKLLSHMLHPFKGTELCVAATLCGWDGENNEMVLSTTESSTSSSQSVKDIESRATGPRLFYVCSDGLRLQGDLFSVGSGSPYAYSMLDGRIRWGMSLDEAVSIAREAVYRATHRDAYSGNNVDLYHVSAKGWRRRKREDLKEEYYRQKEKEKERIEERRTKREKTGLVDF